MSWMCLAAGILARSQITNMNKKQTLLYRTQTAFKVITLINCCTLFQPSCDFVGIPGVPSPDSNPPPIRTFQPAQKHSLLIFRATF